MSHQPKVQIYMTTEQEYVPPPPRPVENVYSGLFLPETNKCENMYDISKPLIRDFTHNPTTQTTSTVDFLKNF